QAELLAAMGDTRGTTAANRLCERCATLCGVDAAALALVGDRAHTGTVGASDTHARRYDELQFTLGEGPCLEAVAAQMPVLVGDLAVAGEGRWPMYGPEVLTCGVRGIFALPVLFA